LLCGGKDLLRTETRANTAKAKALIFVKRICEEKNGKELKDEEHNGQ
jgi:hypothetical protein